MLNKIDPYIRLARLDKPVGIWLLWLPTAWALWIANDNHPSHYLVSLFLLGTILMRSAGCVINDIADRQFDKHVTRTKTRPLAANKLSVSQALVFLFLLLLGSLFVLFALPSGCVMWALIAAGVAVIYPFCKRFIDAPQVVLGVAFSMGIPLAYVASSQPLDGSTLILLAINFAWIIAYDTMYAMTDKDDDLKIGVKSTAIFFGAYDVFILSILLFALHSTWLYWAMTRHVQQAFYLCWALASLILFYQYRLIKNRMPQDCFKAFRVSVYYGALMWGAIFLGL